MRSASFAHVHTIVYLINADQTIIDMRRPESLVPVNSFVIILSLYTSMTHDPSCGEVAEDIAIRSINFAVSRGSLVMIINSLNVKYPRHTGYMG